MQPFSKSHRELWGNQLLNLYGVLEGSRLNPSAAEALIVLVPKVENSAKV